MYPMVTKIFPQIFMFDNQCSLVTDANSCLMIFNYDKRVEFWSKIKSKQNYIEILNNYETWSSLVMKTSYINKISDSA